MGLKYRKNLSESLEQYAARFDPPFNDPNKIRPTWRLQGLRMLTMVPMTTPWEDLVPLVEQSIPRIAPGVPCPTRPADGFGDPIDT